MAFYLRITVSRLHEYEIRQFMESLLAVILYLSKYNNANLDKPGTVYF